MSLKFSKQLLLSLKCIFSKAIFPVAFKKEKKRSWDSDLMLFYCHLVVQALQTLPNIRHIHHSNSICWYEMKKYPHSSNFQSVHVFTDRTEGWVEVGRMGRSEADPANIHWRPWQSCCSLLSLLCYTAPEAFFSLNRSEWSPPMLAQTPESTREQCAGSVQELQTTALWKLNKTTVQSKALLQR